MSKRKRRTTKHIINKSLEYIGGNTGATEIILVDYNEKDTQVTVCSGASQVIGAMRDGSVHWVRVWGLSDTTQVELLGKHFGIHYVDMQDILIPQHIVKVQDNGSHISGIINLLIPSGSDIFTQERIAIVFGHDFILTFQENKESYFSEVAMALQDNLGNIRARKPDYLFCLMMNLLIDRYVELISDMEDQMEDLEDDLLESIDTDDRKQQIQMYRKQQQQLRKVVIPLKEAMIRMYKSDTDLIHDNVRIYFSDLVDRIHYMVESIENMREMVMGLMDLYLANNDLRMNEIMKRLTVVSTIFIPLTFLAGIWGMNFENMPELRTPYGYFSALFVMSVIAFMLWRFMKKKDWY